MRMRLPPKAKALACCLAVAATIMASGFSLPVDAATSAVADHDQGWSCSPQPKLPAWLRVCESADGRFYQIDTGRHGPHGTFTASGAVTLQQVDAETVSASFSPMQAASFRSPSTLLGKVEQAYKEEGDEGIAIDKMRDEQHAPIWVIHPRNDRPGRFLIEMCSSADCSGHIKQESQ